MKLDEMMSGSVAKSTVKDQSGAIQELNDMFGSMSREELGGALKQAIESKKAFRSQVMRAYLDNPLHSPTHKQQMKQMLTLIENLYDVQVSELGSIRRSKR